MINDRTLATLNKSYQDRLNTDVQLQRLVAETNEARRGYQETKISLNESSRKKEMEEAGKKVKDADPVGSTTVNSGDNKKIINNLSD